jgi:hypothetical protein
MNKPPESESQRYPISVGLQRLLVVTAAASYFLWLANSYAVRGFVQTLQRLLNKFL